MRKLSVLSLKNLLEDKKACLREMFKLTEYQTILIRDEKLEELEILLDEKSALIANIDALDYKFKNTIGEIKIEDQTLFNLLNEIKEILTDIKKIDDDNNKKLSSAISDMKGNLKEVRCGKRAMKNYGNSDPYQSFVSQGGTLFIDQDS